MRHPLITNTAAKLVLLVLFASIAAGEPALKPRDVHWLGDGRCRVLVRIEPVTPTSRERDEQVAALEFDLSKLLPDLPDGAYADLRSVQVMRLDAGTGEPQPYGNNAYQLSPCDRPFRFYDRSLLDAFPSNTANISVEAQHNRPLFRVTERDTIPFGHRQFNPAVRARAGTLVWVHTQERNEPAHYAITFDVRNASQRPLNPPAGFVGDGGSRVVKQTTRFGPPGNVSGNAVDWNGDGLPDILMGTAAGNVMIYLNTGSPQAPAFDERHLLYDVDHMPIDVGWDSYPHLADWNGDGRRDLLVGAARGCIVYFQNMGSDTEPRFKLIGFIHADGEMVITPNWPIVGIPEEGRDTVYKSDYTGIPYVVDWNGDGRDDLLVGGFVTGRVYYFENIGTLDDGTPKLTARGPLIDEGTGQPLNTAWAATPFPVDLDGDGDLDLLCGAKPITETGGDRWDATANLRYFENVGTRAEPRLVGRPFPYNQPPPNGQEMQITVVDWSNDGLPDLILVARTAEVFFVRNIGTKRSPLFDMNVKPIVNEWANEQLPLGDMVDWNGDGFPDLIANFRVSLNDGRGLPGRFDRRVSLLPKGQKIEHPVPHGDENAGIAMYDFNRDGTVDCLYGTHGGELWLHRNLGSNDAPDWDVEGEQFMLESGGPAKVGIPPEGVDTNEFNFTVLQGARAKLAGGDFNGDGLSDIVVGDTYGIVRLFMNVGSNDSPRFAEPRIISTHASRVYAQAMDWNGDGRDDVFIVEGRRLLLLESKPDASDTAFKPIRELPITGYATGNIHDIAIGDYNGDGDADFLVPTSHRLTYYIEGSFLKHGYRPATVIDARPRRD